VSVRDAAQYAGSRALTLGFYLLAIIGADGWDRSPDSWTFTTFRLLAAAAFLWWAVDRTVHHHHDDEGQER
jgi:hypothetical protein